MTGDYTNGFAPQIQNWLNLNPTKRPQYVVLFPTIPSRVNSYSNEPPGVYWAAGVTPSVQYRLHTFTQGWQPFVSSINMNGTNDCKAYIDKLEFIGTNYSPGKLLISASAGVYGNTNFVVDNVRHGPGYNPVPGVEDYSGSGAVVSNAITGIQGSGMPGLQITYHDGIETNGSTSLPPHITSATNVAGYISWGFHSALGSDYAVTTNANAVKWTGNSRWWIIETIESNNGKRFSDSGNFLQWFSAAAFGGTNYLNTPVGAVTHVDEPSLPGVNNATVYFGLWAAGKNFAIAAWNSRNTDKFQAVGDPFITR